MTTSPVTAPDTQASWAAHRSLLASFPRDHVEFRRCFALAMLIRANECDSWLQHGTKTLVPDSTIAWASLYDVPRRFFRSSLKREVHWAAVRPTTVKFGVPCLVSGTETGQWDFRANPFAGEPDAMRPETDPQLFAMFTAMEWAMTSVAFVRNRYLRPEVSALHAALGYRRPCKHDVFSYGNGLFDGMPVPAQWMPAAYLAFPAAAQASVYTAVTRAAVAAHPESLTDMPFLFHAFAAAVGDKLAFRAPFAGTVGGHRYDGRFLLVDVTGDDGRKVTAKFLTATAVVKKAAGARVAVDDVVVEERFDATIPKTWHSLSRKAQWDELRKLVPADRVHIELKTWFDRQAISIVPGFVHYPAALAGPAAMALSPGGHLFWDVSESLDYYRDDCDALIFPPVPLNAWYNAAGELPGGVACDLRPADPRFETPWERNARYEDQR